MVSRRFKVSRALATSALASLGLILAVTLGVRADGAGLTGPSLAWLADGSMWSQSINSGTEWWLNLLLFLPAGFLLTRSFRRPLLVALALAATSLVIEVVQSVGLGAPDPADLAANSLGAGAGALGASLVSLIPSSRLGGGRKGIVSGRRLANCLLILVLTFALAWTGAIQIVDSRQRQLTSDVRKTFAGTTAADIAVRINSDYEGLLSATSVRPTYFGRVGNADQYEARYPIVFLGLDRCVFIRWSRPGFTVRMGSGDECTVFRDAPPTM